MVAQTGCFLVPVSPWRGWHCDVQGRGCSISSGTFQLSSSLKTLLLPKMERGSCTAAGSSCGRQDSTTTLLMAPSRIHDTVESCCEAKWWQGEAPKSHPKFKMLHYSLSNAASLDGKCPFCCSLCLHDVLSVKGPHSPPPQQPVSGCATTELCLTPMVPTHEKSAHPDTVACKGFIAGRRAKDGAVPWDQGGRF